MKNARPLFFCLLLGALISCKKAKKIIEIEKNQSISTILNKTSSQKNVLLFIKNDSCDVCKVFYKYVESNYENLIAPKLPEDTEVYMLTINNFKNPNMWLFHLLEGYSFPTVLFVGKGMNVNGVFKGGDLYAFDKFLGNIGSATNNKTIVNSQELKKYSLLLKSYVNLKENNKVADTTYKQVGNLINSRKATFISALVEAYYYKNNKVHPERIAFIKSFLQKNIESSNSYFIAEQKLVEAL